MACMPWFASRLTPPGRSPAPRQATLPQGSGTRRATPPWATCGVLPSRASPCPRLPSKVGFAGGCNEVWIHRLRQPAPSDLTTTSTSQNALARGLSPFLVRLCLHTRGSRWGVSRGSGKHRGGCAETGAPLRARGAWAAEVALPEVRWLEVGRSRFASLSPGRLSPSRLMLPQCRVQRAALLRFAPWTPR